MNKKIFIIEFIFRRKHKLHQELARLHSSLSCFYLSVPNYLQYKKEILATMEQAIHYSRLTKNAHDYLSCLYDIAQVSFSVVNIIVRSRCFRRLFRLMIMKMQKFIC